METPYGLRSQHSSHLRIFAAPSFAKEPLRRRMAFWVVFCIVYMFFGLTPLPVLNIYGPVWRPKCCHTSLSAMTHGFLDCLLYSVHVLWSHPCCHTSLSAMTHEFLDCLLYSVHVLWSHPPACIRYKGLYGDPSAAIHHCLLWRMGFWIVFYMVYMFFGLTPLPVLGIRACMETQVLPYIIVCYDAWVFGLSSI